MRISASSAFAAWRKKHRYVKMFPMLRQSKLKTAAVLISAAIIIFIALFLTVLTVMNKKPNAAFYGISERNRDAIIKILQKTHVRKNGRSEPFNIIILDDTQTLENELKKSKKPDILFIYNGLNADYALALVKNRKLRLPASALDGMTSSIRSIMQIEGNSIGAVPLLIDHYEVDVHTKMFKSSGVQNIETWNDIGRFCKTLESSLTSPAFFAGGNDREIINIVGALTESLSGKVAWDSACKKIVDFNSNGKNSSAELRGLLEKMCGDGGEFYKPVSLLQDWLANGILRRNVYQTQLSDIKFFMSGDLSALALLTLSEHRKLEHAAISQFTSVYYPSDFAGNERHFTAPIIMGIPLSKNKTAHNSLIQMAGNFQSELSMTSGLAPVQANAAVPDVQADDVRYWVAASSSPLPSLSDAAFKSEDERAAFAKELRNILQDS